MEEPPGSYAPRSPDLSALISASSYSDPNNDANPSGNLVAAPHDINNPSNGNNPYLMPPHASHPSSYAQPPQFSRHDSFSLPQSSYYQPPPLLQPQNPASSFGYPPYQQMPQQMQQPQSPQNKRIKHDPEDESWPPDLQQQQMSGRGRPGRPASSKKASKSSAAAAATSAKVEEQSPPREPAPGEIAGVIVKTKFPVARIKRIVQADDEVGKVAQVTPVAVGKALELFMIHLTLASADVATGSTGGERKGGSVGSSKRVTSAHIKSAILKHDEFDFLRPIADKIPDGPAGGASREGKGSKGKAESEEDADFDMDDGEDDGDGTYGSRSKRKASGKDRSSRRA